MKCLILGCAREADRWYRVDQESGPFLTASCTQCEERALQSVVGLRAPGRVVESVVTRIGHDEFLVTEVMETMDVLRANVDVGNGRLLYAPVSEG